MLNKEDLVQRVAELAANDPRFLERFEAWLLHHERGWQERFVFSDSYNTACGCHPEFTEVNGEEPSLKDLVSKIAFGETQHFKIDIDRIKVVRDLNEVELQEAASLLGQTRTVVVANRKAAELEAKKKEMREEIERSRRYLNGDRKDLNQEAITRREAKIAEKTRELEALG